MSFVRSKLSLAVISAIGILGVAGSAFAQGSIVVDQSGTQSFDSNVVINPNTKVDDTYVGISGNENIEGILNAPNISVNGDFGDTDTVSAVYLGQSGTNLTINGNLSADLQGLGVTGLYLKKDAALTINGNVDLVLNGVSSDTSKTAIGLRLQGEKADDPVNLNIKGDHFKVIANDGDLRGIYLTNANATIESNDIYIETNITEDKKQGLNQGFYVYDSELTLNGGKTSIVLNSNGAQLEQRGINVLSDPGHKTVVNINTDEFHLDVNGGGYGTYGLMSSGVGGEINIASKVVDIDVVDGEAYGLWTQYGGEINFTNPEAQINIAVHGIDYAVGIDNSVYGGNGTRQFGTVNIAGNLSIFAETKNGGAYGIMSDSYGAVQQHNDKLGIFLTGSTTINVRATGEKGYAVGVGSDNTVYDSSALEPNAKVSIHNLTVTATGEDGATSVGIEATNNGHLSLSGTAVVNAVGDKAIGMNLEDSDIKISGSASIEGSTTGVQVNDHGQISLDKEGTLSTNSMQSVGTTTMAEGSQLKVTGSKDGRSELGAIDATKGTVSVGAGVFAISTFSGDDNSLVLSDLANTKGVGITTKMGSLNIVANGTSNDQYANAQEAADALLDAVHVQNDQAKDQNKVEVQVGDVNDGLSATLTEDGKLDNVSVTKNDKLDAFGSVTALSALTLRHEMNSLSKRMGELRDAPAGVGVWVRGYGSEMEYGAQNIKSKNNSIQMGSDYTVGDWKVGAALTYTDGESSYDSGSADNKGYGVAVYGTWFVPCGAYIDLMAKYNRLDNDFALNGMDGSYDANAYGVSAETGYRFNFMDGGVYVEPQVGIAYSRMTGETFTASNDVTIEQDDYDSLIGRVGVRTGFKFPKDKGTIYARVSGVYDFQGEVNGTATKGQAFNTIEEDLGGAWLELGVGANFNWTKNTYTYIDFECTNGGEVKENYRWNIGVRHTF